MLAGNVVALLSPMIFIPILTYGFGPQNYDWKSMAMIRLADDSDVVKNTDVEGIPVAVGLTPEQNEKEQATLKRASLVAKAVTAAMTLILLVLWPIPLYAESKIFSKSFFTGWVVVGILWLFCSAFTVGLYPLWEGRAGMAYTFKSILKDISGKGKPDPVGRQHEILEGATGSGEGSEGSEAGGNEKERAIESGVLEKQATS